MSAEKSTKNTDPVEPKTDDHILRDGDFINIIGLLNMLSRQLELSLEDGHKDYQVITDYCIGSGSASIDSTSEKADLVKALQYYDRYCQRVEHVLYSLTTLAKNMQDESWSSIDMDLDAEVKKTNSFYDEVQTREMLYLATGFCQLDDANQSSDKQDNSGESTSDDDMELF